MEEELTIEKHNKIETIQIKNLYNKIDVNIPFKYNTMIWIADNGTGKTTILNIINAIISNNILHLNNYIFDEIIINLQNQGKIVIQKTMLRDNMIWTHARNIQKLLDKNNRLNIPQRYMIDAHTKELLNIIKKKKILANNTNQVDLFDNSSNDQINKYGIFWVQEQLTQLFTLSTIFLPTYRNVEHFLTEEDMEDREEYFSYHDRRRYENDFKRNIDPDLFTMASVQKMIDNICDALKIQTVKSFKDLSGIFLRELINKKPDSDNQSEQKLNERIKNSIGKIKLILSRLEISKNIDNDEYNTIIEQIEDETSSNTMLKLIILRLVDGYHEQEKYDNQLNTFIFVCNKYLNYKQFIYNELSFDITLVNYNTDNQDRIVDENMLSQYKLSQLNQDSSNEIKDHLPLASLSSGEKQVVSIFARIYLDAKTKYNILIDEPELSLSIEWQETILPDIIKANKHELLIVSTHSPFIFSHDSLKNHVSDVREYITIKED